MFLWRNPRRKGAPYLQWGPLLKTAAQFDTRELCEVAKEAELRRRSTVYVGNFHIIYGFLMYVFSCTSLKPIQNRNHEPRVDQRSQDNVSLQKPVSLVYQWAELAGGREASDFPLTEYPKSCRKVPDANSLALKCPSLRHLKTNRGSQRAGKVSVMNNDERFISK